MYSIGADNGKMNVQQDHGHRQDQQGRQGQRDPKEKSHHKTIRSQLQSREPARIPLFSRLK